MKRDQVFVRAKCVDGKWRSVDFLDLTRESQMVFIMDRLVFAGVVVALKDEAVAGEHLELHAASHATIED